MCLLYENRSHVHVCSDREYIIALQYIQLVAGVCVCVYVSYPKHRCGCLSIHETRVTQHFSQRESCSPWVSWSIHKVGSLVCVCVCVCVCTVLLCHLVALLLLFVWGTVLGLLCLRVVDGFQTLWRCDDPELVCEQLQLLMMPYTTQVEILLSGNKLPILHVLPKWSLI